MWVLWSNLCVVEFGDLWFNLHSSGAMGETNPEIHYIYAYNVPMNEHILLHVVEGDAARSGEIFWGYGDKELLCHVHPNIVNCNGVIRVLVAEMLTLLKCIHWSMWCQLWNSLSTAFPKMKILLWITAMKPSRWKLPSTSLLLLLLLLSLYL